jgi:phage tail protein X
MLLRKVNEGDDIDLLCLEIYGFTDGAVEAVLKENPEAMDDIDNFGRVLALDHPLVLRFPEVRKPKEVVRITRLFD